MSNAQKGQDIALQAGKAAKKAGRLLGAGLNKITSKVKEGTQSFKEGLKDDEDEDVVAQSAESSMSYGDDEAVQQEPVTDSDEVEVQYDYSLDDD